jgi:hypothetical protein
MSAQQRRSRLLGAALVATLALAAWVGSHDETPDTRAPRSAPASTAAHGSRPPLALVFDPATLPARRAAFRPAREDPFAPKSWAPPAPAQAQRAPVAPPLPYRYFGRMTEDGRTLVFLQRGERTYTVSPGDVLDGQYRVDAIKPDGVLFTYLPLKQKQALPIGVNSQ